MLLEPAPPLIQRTLPKLHIANTPVTRAGDPLWDDRITAITADLAAKQGAVDLLLFGQSITQLWTDGATGLPIFNAYYANKGRRPMNQGISGDTTQSMLYRLINLDHLRGIAPKLTVLEAGTNNVFQHNDVELTVDGILAVAKTIRAKCPTSKVLVMTTFPSDVVGTETRNAINRIRALIRQRPEFDMRSLILRDITDDFFLAGTQTINTNLLPDQTHPNTQGFAMWAARIETIVASILG